MAQRDHGTKTLFLWRGDALRYAMMGLDSLQQWEKYNISISRSHLLFQNGSFLKPFQFDGVGCAF